MRIVTLTLLLLAAASPAAARASSFVGHANGYHLIFEPGRGVAKLRLPAPAKRLTAFQISCGKTRHGGRESVLALAPLSTTSSLSGPLEDWPHTHRWCTIKRKNHKVASLHLHH